MIQTYNNKTLSCGFLKRVKEEGERNKPLKPENVYIGRIYCFYSDVNMSINSAFYRSVGGMIKV